MVAIPILDRFTPEEWTAISAAATFVVPLLTLGTLWYNRRVVVEMKEDRLAQTRPHIILDFAVSGEDLHLRIRNYGGPASQVRFLFVPPLTNSSGRDIGRMPLLSVPLPLLPEGEVLEETFDSYWKFFSIDYLLGKRGAFFTTIVKYKDPVTNRSYPDQHIGMDISVLGPVVRPERIELAELADREWRWHVKEASDEQLVDQITREIGELADHGDERRGLRSRGWEVFTDNWRHKSAQLVAVCTTGTLVGTAVYADSWEDNVSERLALAKVLELEKQASSTPQEVPTATFWNRLITSITRIVQSEKER